MRENIRSGRRANFYITENSFIDNYAKAVGPMCAVVYNVLERYMNSETRSTWVGTAKIAEVVGTTQRTVQRNLKTLQEFKLIKILRTPTATTYVVLPVPPKPKETTIPLFDAVDDQDVLWRGDTSVADATTSSFDATDASYPATTGSWYRDATDTANKEEQDDLNKTKEQDFFNNAKVGTLRSAKTLVRALKLSDTSMGAAIAAIEASRNHRTYSSDWADSRVPFAETVNEIVVKADEARRKNISGEKFLDHFLAEQSAEQVLEDLALTATRNMSSTVALAIKAEAAFSKLPIDKAARHITSSAIEDRERGVTLDRFYFENNKWRSNARVNKAEQRKLDNLAASARAKEILRGQFR